jgi:hypothetical protein
MSKLPNGNAPQENGNEEVSQSRAENSCTKLPEAKTVELTPDEQWELFEKDLKESDWGHQPC